MIGNRFVLCSKCKFGNSVGGILRIKWAAKRAIGCRNGFVHCPEESSFRLCRPFLASCELTRIIRKIPPSSFALSASFQQKEANMRLAHLAANLHILSAVNRSRGGFSRL